MKELSFEKMENLGGAYGGECDGYLWGVAGAAFGFAWAVGGAIIGAKRCAKYLEYEFGCLGWCGS
jgi:hypothetical protein